MVAKCCGIAFSIFLIIPALTGCGTTTRTKEPERRGETENEVNKTRDRSAQNVEFKRELERARNELERRRELLVEVQKRNAAIEGLERDLKRARKETENIDDERKLAEIEKRELELVRARNKIESITEIYYREFRLGGSDRNLSSLFRKLGREVGLHGPTACVDCGSIFHSLKGSRTTRIFTDRTGYPPSEFAAYGIVVFPARATPATRDRHMRFCQAYVASIPHTSEELLTPRSQQMVTVWPIDSSKKSEIVNILPREDTCDKAIDSYGLTMALQALRQANKLGANVRGRGPYLLAWSPGAELGEQDALVLVSNMSSVSTDEEAVNTFSEWRKEIERKPELWRSGWNIQQIRTELRRFVDLHGPRLSNLIRGEDD